MASENKLQEIIKTSLENIRTMIDANTVIGTPYTTPSGTTIIPVSKVSMGFATGGLDYSGKAESQPQNFGAGGGTGLSIQPLGFLVIAPDGSVEMVNSLRILLTVLLKSLRKSKRFSKRNPLKKRKKKPQKPLKHWKQQTAQSNPSFLQYGETSRVFKKFPLLPFA